MRTSRKSLWLFLSRIFPAVRQNLPDTQAEPRASAHLCQYFSCAASACPCCFSYHDGIRPGRHLEWINCPKQSTRPDAPCSRPCQPDALNLQLLLAYRLNANFLLYLSKYQMFYTYLLDFQRYKK